MKRKLINVGVVFIGALALRFGAPKAVDSFGDYWKCIYSGLEVSRKIYGELEKLSTNSIRNAQDRIEEINSEFRFDEEYALENFGNYTTISGLGIMAMTIGCYGLGKEIFRQKKV